MVVMEVVWVSVRGRKCSFIRSIIEKVVIIQKFILNSFEIDYFPGNATATIDDSNTILVHFQNSSSLITGFNVYLTPNRELSLPLSLWQRIETIDSSILIDPDQHDISPNTRYRLRISANESDSEQDPSHEVIIPTGNGVPNPPNNIAISITDKTTVAVSFKPVLFRRARRKFATEYLIEFTEDQSKSPELWTKMPIKTVKPKANKDVVALISDLKPNVTYYVAVRSMCAKNAGPASQVEQFDLEMLSSRFLRFEKRFKNVKKAIKRNEKTMPKAGICVATATT
ncbi:hypothetical protein L596_030313 [Steinernema carpocapsae]|uniref:Fibronectin type-III domain-containing protein n=1 Tax=Steinernema carpocapsae TaxID=34508 RepID=A0A4U5LP04_STECR|nr:hypothetical protein L596_030313 [Steinernema carpocapsae]